MKLYFTVLTIFFSALGNAQSIESKVCSCIRDNFNSIGVDYEEEISMIKSDLIDNKIIESNFDSIIGQFEQLKQHGYINKTRKIENVLIEQTGIRTIHYCIAMYTYSSNLEEVPILYNMLGEIKALGYSDQKLDIKRLRRQVATIILNYFKPEYEGSKLWNYILIQYLYLLSETEMMKEIERFYYYNDSQKDTTNTIKLYVNKNNDIFLEDVKVSNNKLCDLLIPFLKNGKRVLLQYEKDTNYGVYIKVFNQLNECYSTIRNRKAIELYKKEFPDLTKDQKAKINKIIEVKITEFQIE